VVVAERLGMHAGELGGDRDHEQRRFLVEVVERTPGHAEPSVPARWPRGSSLSVALAYASSAALASALSRGGTATSIETSRSPRVPSLRGTPRPFTRKVRPVVVPGGIFKETL